MRRGMFVAGVGTIAVLSCNGGGGSGSSSSGSSSAALGQWLDRYPAAYCDWRAGCRDGGAGCVADVNGEIAIYRNCAAASTFFTQHQAALEACLTTKPACASDDAESFCAALAGFDDLEKQCKDGTPSSSGSSSGSTGSPGGATCDGKPAGAFRCEGASSVEVCKNGVWTAAGGCCAIKSGDARKPPYAATCKSLIGTTNGVECSYAGLQCKQCVPGKDCETTCTKCASENSTSCCP